ncbi:MAG: amidohydrolase, partial [Rhodothermales bacterium]
MTRLACFSLIVLVVCFVTMRAAATPEPHLSLLPPSLMQETDTTKADTTKAKKKKDKPLPLEADRAVSFTTDEGSWLSLDVSPDGQTLVFELLGDLYTLPISGGTATPVTSGMAFDSQPRYSPDGTKLLFISDRSGSNNLWVIDFAKEDTLQVTKGKTSRYESPEWAPDGKYIVVSKGDGRFGTTKLWLLHADGGSGVALIKEPENLRTLGAAFTPDGRYIWFAQRTGSWQYNAIFPQYQLAVYDRETGETYTRTSRYGSAFRPTLSPDGKWLVYGTRYEAETGLRLRDLTTGEERWLAYPVQRDDQESIASRDVLPGMSFTPDAEEVVVSYGGKIWRLPVNGGDAIPVPFTVEVDLEVGPELAFDYPVEDTPTFTVRQIRDAVPSPDGAKLAFTALDRLYVMDYPDGTPRRLTDGAMVEAQPVWSPDGQWIAYVTWSDDDGGRLYKVQANGQGPPQQLSTTAAIYQQPAWSPDGQRIAAIRGPARAYQESTGPRAPGAADDLVWISADGGAATVIAPTEGRSRPHFTQDPDRVYLFHSEKGLVSIRWDGTDEKARVKVTGNTRPGQEEPNRASVILMAPMGDQALAQVNSDLYVVTVPYVGGETPTISVNKPEEAAFPARKLTDIGGQFPAWSADGRAVHWSIGNAHVVYDLDAAQAFADSVKAAQKAAADEESEEGEESEED